MSRPADPPLTHQEAWELIPWHVNGTLGSAEAARLEAHLDRCPLCRREMEVSRELATAVRDSGELPSPEPALARVMERLDGAPPGRRLPPGWWSASPRPARRALAVSLAAVLLLTVALGAVLLAPPAAPGPPVRPASFRTLSAPDPGAAVAVEGFRVRLVFSPAITEPELRRLLLADGGRLVDGPSPAGVYTAAFPSATDPGAGATTPEILARLRAAPLVELAEPVTRGPGGGP